MRIAVLSDIHANGEALEAVLNHSAGKSVARYVCLGDIVGYGASPNECIDMLGSLPQCYSVLGNHDAALLGFPVRMSKNARTVINWTRGTLRKSNVWYLKEMEDCITWDSMTFSHSNPYRPRSYHYISERNTITTAFGRSKAKILFIGHTHVPVVITRRNIFCVYIRSPLHSMVVPAAEMNRQIFNCGSVGQPRDGDSRSSYLIYDDRTQLVEFYRIEYDIDRASEKILAARLPRILAERLRNGV